MKKSIFKNDTNFFKSIELDEHGLIKSKGPWKKGKKGKEDIINIIKESKTSNEAAEKISKIKLPEGFISKLRKKYPNALTGRIAFEKFYEDIKKY